MIGGTTAMIQAPGFKLRQLSLRIALCTGAAGIAALAPALPAMANPSGAAVVHGSATFMQDGGLLQIDNSPGAIINWTSFSIAQDEITRFQQQSAQSAVLNRVTGGEISEIFGQLVSNGHVFLINPNGMVFGQNATIDTAGFVASTLDITNQDFLDGNYRFAGDSGRIINEGYLTTRSGNVYFIAPDIENAGIIHAESGALVLAAGRSIRIGSLDAPDIQFEITAPDDAIINLGQLLADQGSIHAFAGTLTHSGAISASGAALAEDGSVILYADGDIHLQAGSTISASGASGGDILVQSRAGTVLSGGEILAEGANGDGGRIRLLGDKVGLLGQARVSAEGSGDGGEILIGGNVTGLGPEPNAKAVFIGTDTRVSASSTDSGDGGTIIAYADDLNRTYGRLTARGGPNGGDGGFIETSAAFIEVTRTPDAGASNGAPGQWLIDPDLLVIDANGLVEVNEQDFDSLIIFSADPEAQAPTIQNTLIENAINSGTSVWVQTAFETAGSIRILAPLTFNATESGLVLNFFVDTGPDDNIFVEAPIINTGPVSLEYGFIIGPGFVDFGADVDTGGSGDGLIIINSGQGATATFSSDVTLRGNLRTFIAGADIDGFNVIVDGDASLDQLTLRNDASLTVNGTLTVSSGIGAFVMSSSMLAVGGDFFADEVELTLASSAFVEGSMQVELSTLVFDSDLTVRGNALFLDDVIAQNSSLDFASTLDAPFVDLSLSTLTLSGVASSIDTLFMSGSDLLLDGITLDVGILDLDGTIASDGTLLISSIMDWRSGTLGGTGSNLTVVINEGANAFIATPGTRFMEGSAALFVDGSLGWFDGDITMSDAARINIINLGIFDIELTTSRTLGFAGGAPLLAIAPGATLNNSGAGVATIDVTTNMNGLAVSSGADLLFSRGGFHTGSFEGLMGGRISFGGTFANSHTITGPVSGPGTIRFTETEGGVNRVFSDPQYQPFETIIDGGIVRFDVSAETQRLLLSNGAVEVDGQMFVRDRMEWTGGVVNTFGSFGLLNIDEGATLEISGANDKFLSGGARLDNEGTINWLAGDIVMGGTAELLNNGTLSTLQADGPRSILPSFGSPSLINTVLGTLEFASAGDTLPIEMQINSSIDGIVNVDNVALRFSGGGAHGGSYLIDSGSVEFAGTDNHAWQDGLNFAGNGFVEVSGGFVLVTAETVALENLRFSGGTISGNGELLVANNMNWSAGTLGGEGVTGSLEIGQEATLDISGIVVGLNDWRLTNLGQVNWFGGNIDFNNSALIENFGEFNAFLTGGSGFLFQGIGDGGRFDNHGQLLVAPDAGDLLSGVFINNFGDIQIDNEVTRLLRDSMTFSEGGSWSISEGSTLQLEFGVHVAESGVSFSGPGTLGVDPNATLAAIDGPVFVDNLFLNGGRVVGPGAMHVGNSFNWRSGTVDGSTLTLESGGQALFSTEGLKILNFGLIQLGAETNTVWSGGEIRLVDEAIIEAAGDFFVRTNSNITSPDESGYIDNTGSITKDTTTGTTRFQTRFDNNGTMTALSGTISLERDGTHFGDFFVLPPADIVFIGEHQLLGSFENLGDQVFTDATMIIDGPFTAGNVIIRDFSDITFNGTYAAAATSILNNSVATFLFAASTGDLTMDSSSDVQGPGTLTVTGNAMLDVLSLTRQGNTVFDASSTLNASAISLSGPGTLSLNGTSSLGSLGVQGSQVSIGGNLTTGALVIESGTFTGPGTTDVTSSLILENDGVLTGTGNVTVGGTFAWLGGLISGTGLLDLAPGGSLNSNPGAVLVMQDRTLRNRSDIGIELLDAQLALNGNAVLDNQGRMRLELSPGMFLNVISGTGVVLNSGSFEATASGSSAVIANRFDNSGSLTVNSGILRLQGGGTHSGNFLMVGPTEGGLNSGRLRFGGTHTLSASSLLEGGSFGVEFGTTTINGAIDLEGMFVTAGNADAPGRLIINSDADLSQFSLIDQNPEDDLTPTLGGSGNISVANLFIWEGGTIGGSGLFVIAETAEISQFGLGATRPEGTTVPLLTLSGRTFSTAIPDALLERGRLQIIDGAVFENSGGFSFGSEGGAPFIVEGGSNGTFRNTGTVTGASDLVFGTTTQNSGTLQAPNLELAAGVTLTQPEGSISTPGTFNVGGGFSLLGGSVAATTTNVNGSFGGIGTVTGNLNNAGVLSPGTSPGALTIDGNFTQSDLGTLILEVDGDASQPGVDFDLLTITGSASFDGTLELIALDGFSGAFGTSFQPITYASATGGFARIVQPSDGVQFTPVFGPNGLTAQAGLALNPDGTANIDPDDPPIPRNQAEAELIADAVARSRGTTQEQIETTNTTVTLSNEQQQVQDECAERLDRPDATGDSTGQGVGCRSM